MKRYQKIHGGEAFKWSIDMASVSMTQAHWDAIRSGEMAKSWYADVAQACWEACKERAVAQLYAAMHSAAMFRGDIRVDVKTKLAIVAQKKEPQP